MAKTRKKNSSKSKSSKPKKVKIPQRIPQEEKIIQYVHNYTKRSNNPPVGLVTPETDEDLPLKKYSYDPHLDPQLIWAGKKEHTSFDVDTVSLHIHERIDPLTVIEKVLKTYKTGRIQKTLFEFFGLPENNPPLREAIEFYKHDQMWSNRLISGDSLLVMNSLIQKEGLEGKVQMIFIDPPYGIRYSSNFQPFVNNQNVTNGKDEDLTQEPEMIKAFRDTWELEIHSYLTYLRDRLLLAKELLSETGSCFVQISDENLHHVKEIMDEVFGPKNFVRIISFRKRSMALTTNFLPKMDDYIIWYAKDIKKAKFRDIFIPKSVEDDSEFAFIDVDNNNFRRMTNDEVSSRDFINKNIDKIFKRLDFCASGYTKSTDFPIQLDKETFHPRANVSWKTHKDGVNILQSQHRLFSLGKSLYYKIYFNDFPLTKLTNIWTDTRGEVSKIYVVQTSEIIIQRCIMMTTDPGDLVFDPTCGSGTTAYIAEKFGRRWITCDTSRVAIALTKQRLMTAIFDYYELAHPREGLASGLQYKIVPHITLGSLANKEPTPNEILHDQPVINKSKTRICGPFTVEAVPSPVVKSFDADEHNLSNTLEHNQETTRQDEWRNELFRTGVRGKNNQKIEFSRIEAIPGTQWLHADAETKENDPKRVVISFGPEYAPLEQRQVALAIEESQKLIPKPKIVIFAAFEFDPEAGKDIDELNWPGINILRAQMNADLLTSDLKKQRTSNESFWLMGQPDIEMKKNKDGKYVVKVHGFDYYNTKSGEIESGDSSKIAMWMLDADYNGQSLYPQQIFFPMAGPSEGWSKLTNLLKTEIDEELIEQYRGTISLPFIPGNNKRVAVKIIDDRGIESLKILKVM